jgi:ribosome-associated toxin RatA of RatAB toxin-antitoxin module
MPVVQRDALVPYSASTMYDLVNDVQNYPDFLPWCSNTEIISQSDKLMQAKVYIQKGNIKHAFVTNNTITPNERIEMQLVNGPFKDLNGHWQFEAMEHGCKVSLYLNFEFSSKLMALGFGPFFKQACESMLNAFIQRARAVYA